MSNNEMSLNNNRMLLRYLPLIGGLLTSTMCGMLLYAFSVFINPLNEAFGWSCSDIAFAFSICCLSNGSMAFFAGRLTDKFGPRYVVMTGGILTACGFIMSGYVKTVYELYFFYGIMSGIGSGLIYLPPIVTAPKWWPDRPALATGFVVSGLGIGAFFMGPLADYINLVFGWQYIFFYCGIVMLVMGLLAGLFLKNPPRNFSIEINANSNKTSKIPKTSKTCVQAIKTRHFWFLYLSYFFAATAGLMIIGHIAVHGEDQGLSSRNAAIAVSAFAITNALTRILSGLIVDKIKIRKYFSLLLFAQSIAVLLLYPAGSNYCSLWFIATIIGWNYGAMFMLFPTTVLNFFGPKEQGSIYGLLFTSYGLAGFIGPWFGGLIKDATGKYWIAFLVSSIIVGMASLIIWNLRSPRQIKK